jgi:hypothetical protein
MSGHLARGTAPVVVASGLRTAFISGQVAWDAHEHMIGACSSEPCYATLFIGPMIIRLADVPRTFVE